MNMNGNLSTSMQKKAMILGVIGLALILLGGKLAIDTYYTDHIALDLDGKPALLYVTDENPCECAKRMIAEADYQIKNWSAPNRMEVQLIRVSLGEHPGLEAKYDVFRAPTLILVDAQGEIVHRQDYPLIGGKPFDFPLFESMLAQMSNLQ